MPLQAIEQKRLYTQIAEQITSLIESGEYQAGQQLPSERDLSVLFKVSRPTVREALIALEVSGLIDVRVGVGVFIRQMKRQELDIPAYSPIQVQQTRLLIEPEVARQAALGWTLAASQRLRHNLKQMEQSLRRQRWSLELDREFHLLIAEQTGNQVILSILGELWDKRRELVASKFDEHILEQTSARERVIADHHAIARALDSRDAEAAYQTVFRHLSQSVQEMTDHRMTSTLE